VRAWDPVAMDAARAVLSGVEFCDSVLEAVSGADAAVIVTEWPELAGLASPEVRSAMRTPVIVDGRNSLDPREVRLAGFAYEGIGHRSEATSISTAADRIGRPLQGSQRGPA
jgi:UDPglucose 6-dehydrogenase